MEVKNKRMDIVNIAAYRFVPLPDPALLREPLKTLCKALGLKGTILLAPEGVNFFLAGSAPAIDDFVCRLEGDERFAPLFKDIPIKRSVSAEQPFRRMLVRIKKEIITMREPALAPSLGRAPAVSARTLARWLDQGEDDSGKPILLLDTRNAFEVDLGTFDHAVRLDIARFSDFPGAFRNALATGAINPGGQHIVTFCTGGIRCEKAALFLAKEGAADVSQLDGGILKYFEEVGSSHWHGECFVFDDRVALNAELLPTNTVQCYACRAVVTPAEQADRRYQRGVSCPHCAKAEAVSLEAT